jgi:hypothetical protein
MIAILRVEKEQMFMWSWQKVIPCKAHRNPFHELCLTPSLNAWQFTVSKQLYI